MAFYFRGLGGGSKNRTFQNAIITTLTTAAIALSVYALNGQTADLLGFFDSNENKIAGVEADGTFYGPDFTSRYNEAGEFSLNDFYDNFDFTGATNGQVLAYNSSLQKFEPQNQLEYSSGFEDIENTYTAKIANNGTTASVIEQKGGWIDSVTRTDTGFVTITFTTGFFSQPPIIKPESTNNTGVEVHKADVDAPTTTSNAYIFTRTALSYNGVDDDFTIVAHRSGSDRNEPTIYYDATLDIDGRIETATTDTANDFLLLYDASEGANRKVSPENLGLTTPPSGSDGQIQFNDGGSFGADSGLIWDNTNKRLGINSNGSPAYDLEIGSISGTTDRQIRMYGSSGLQFRIYMTSTQTGFYGTRDMFITTSAASRQIYMVPGNTATVEFDINKTTFTRAVAFPIETVTTDTTLDATNYTVLVDTSGGDVTITLPSASGITGGVYNIKKISSDANKVIIDGNGSETIDGALTREISFQYTNIQIQGDGASWWRL